MDERVVRAKLEGILERAETARLPVGGWEARTAVHRGPGLYDSESAWSSMGDGGRWPAGRTAFLRVHAVPPDVPDGARLLLGFRMRQLEGLLSIDGVPFAGIDREHPEVEVPHGRPLFLEAEFCCVPDARHEPALRGEAAVLDGVSFLLRDRETEALYHDVLFAWGASRAAADQRRREVLSAAVEDVLLGVDLTAPAAVFRAEVFQARGLLRGRLALIHRDPEAGSVFLTGHSHIDTAWLWPLRETVRKCGRTFSTALRLMERYPAYRFSCSQPQLYAYAKEHFPALYARIRERVKEGRWECTGGMWVEADCNVPSGESLIRQVLQGNRFFQEEFGVRSRTCWLPDVFGYPATLPGILKGCGIDYFYTNKLHWQARNPFPYHLFHWEGADGSRVLAHIPRLKNYYNGNPSPEELAIAWERFQEKAVYPQTLFPFGHGDGGGGPTEAMLEAAARAERFPGVPAAEQGCQERYFDAVRAASPDLPVWSGELYLETHRGTYTTQGAMKKANRRGEVLLREAEIWTSVAAFAGKDHARSRAGGRGEDRAGFLRDEWRSFLTLQFHDILPGSSIAEVYAEALAEHGRIAARALAARDGALSSLRAGCPVGALAVFNSLNWDRADPVTVDVPASALPAGLRAQDRLEAVGPDGEAAACQRIAEGSGSVRVLFEPGRVPGLGWACFVLRAAEDGGKPNAAPSLAVSAKGMENRYYTMELSAEGDIVRLYDKRAGREVLPQGTAANRLRLYQDGPERESAWNVHAEGEKREYGWDPGTEVRVLEGGPVRVAVRVTRRRRASMVEQDVVLYAASDRIDFITRADWKERQTLLKASFPVEVLSPRASFEVQFGAVERATHRNTSWEQEKFEVCAHRWADLSESGFGVSLLNDCKYGWDVRGNVLRLTLLRGAQFPDPEADVGRHEFTYSLLPHAGDWREAGTVRRAWELNAPMTALPCGGRGDRTAALPSGRFLSVDGNAVLEAFKPAEDGEGWILRFSEPYGGRGAVRIGLPGSVGSVEECTHLEDGIGEVPLADNRFRFTLTPFQVRSFRLRP